MKKMKLLNENILSGMYYNFYCMFYFSLDCILFFNYNCFFKFKLSKNNFSYIIYLKTIIIYILLF